MNFRFFIASVLFLFIASSFSLGTVFADTHYANPGNYKSVLGAAGYSDTIIFNNGVYSVDEPIEVLKSWKLFAANPGGAVLRATESIHTLVDVWSSDVVVSGLVLDGNGLSNYGIHGNYEGHYAINGNFNGNTIINNKRFGVLLTNTNSVFSNNYVANNGEVGIGLLDSSTSTLTGNTVVGSVYTGIYLYNSPGSSLSGNVVNGNGGHGIFLRLSPYSWIQNNVANGNGWTGINLESSGSSAVVTNNANSNHIAGLWLTSTDSTPIIGNTFQYNPYGAAFTNSNGNQFSFNTVTNNVYGITTPYSNPVSNNLIMDNSGWGISMDTYGNNLNNPTITDTQIYRNGIGIKLTGNNNILGTLLFLNNSVLANNYALEFTGNNNLLNGTQLFGNTNGLHLSGDGNVLTNLTVVYNTLNGVLIDGNGNRLNDSYFLNNTNGLILNGNLNNINNIFLLNNTNALTLNENNNLVNGSGVLNGTNGFFITGKGNVVANNSVSNQNNTAMYINGNNIVTGNGLTDNNGTGLLIRGDNDVVDFLNMLGNTIIRNGQGINIQGNNNNINNILTLFNILLDNGYSLTITGNNNQMNNTILTLNRNGLQVIGDNNTFSNITSRFNNQTGIIFNGNNNTLDSSLLQNNTNGLIVNGSENHVNSTLIFNSTNGSTINGDNNNLTGNNVHNNTENGLIINGSNNTFIQNNITGNPNAILVENGTNNTLNYNRIAGNTHNLHNNGHGTVDAQYNWWGQKNPICITGMNINTNNQAVAVLNVPSGTINPGQIYDITVTLRSSTGEELKMEIPSFLVQFFINNGGDVYPETAPLINNSAWTQLQVFNPGSYTLTTTIDQQTLTSTLSTPVNSQPVTPHRIPRKPADPAPNNNLCGAMALGNLLNSLGARADANLISQIGGLTDQGISMYGLTQAASYYGINLVGLHLDSSQLKTNDIVLLNINGNNHYAIILGKLGDNYIIQDPFLGTVIMTTEQFNKYYTGNALTMNPDGRGTPLSTAEMENLFGAVYTGLFNPYDPCSYAAIKSMEATQKAIQTGNPWDYFNYTFLTIPGYKNWDGWGVGNIKALLDFGLGIDENGDMSMGNTLINLVSLIPIARVASWGGKALKGAGILEKLGLNINLGDNWLIRKIGDFTGDLGKKLKLDNPENLKNLVSGVSNVIFPNPVGWFTSTLEFGAKLTKNENLISAAKYLNDFQLKRGIGDLGGFISDPIGKLKDAYFKTGKLLNDNITYTAQLASAAISNAKTAVVKTAAAIKTVVNKTITQVKTAVNKVVTKVKTAISNAVKTVKTVANNVINTVNNTVNWIKGKVWPW